jgi:hypothetical protein
LQCYFGIELLGECAPKYRGWEWGWLEFLCNQDYHTFSHAYDPHHPRQALRDLVDPVGNQVLLPRTINQFDVRHALRHELRYSRDPGAERCFGHLSPRGRWLAETHTSATSESFLRDTRDWQRVMTFTAFYHWSWELTFSPDDTRMAARTGPETVDV